MKISIITATYNCAKTLTSTLQSISSQNFRNFEHLVMDGGSTDSTLDILHAWTGHPITIHSSQDHGLYDALNKGIERSTGDVVGFLHADDVFQDEYALTKISRSFDGSNIQIVYGDLVYVSQSNIDHVIRKWRSSEFDANKLTRGWMPPHPTFYARRALYSQYGGFDLRYRISADYDCMLRLLKIPYIQTRYIPAIIVRMRMGGESNRSIPNIVRKSIEDIKISRSHFGSGFLIVFLKNFSKLVQFLK